MLKSDETVVCWANFGRDGRLRVGKNRARVKRDGSVDILLAGSWSKPYNAGEMGVVFFHDLEGALDFLKKGLQSHVDQLNSKMRTIDVYDVDDFYSNGSGQNQNDEDDCS